MVVIMCITAHPAYRVAAKDATERASIVLVAVVIVLHVQLAHGFFQRGHARHLAICV